MLPSDALSAYLAAKQHLDAHPLSGSAHTDLRIATENYNDAIYRAARRARLGFGPYDTPRKTR